MAIICLAAGGGDGTAFVSVTAGAAADSIGDVKFSGGVGGGGTAANGSGGGSSAGTAANGNAATSAATGASAPSGGGAGGNGGAAAVAGGNATAPGGGGGGGGKTAAGSIGRGAGGNGQIVITPNTGSSTTYTTPGTSIYTVGAGVTSIDIECWGGGSSGSIGQTTTAGPGGGGGAYAKKTVSVTASRQLYVTVGQGGTSGTVGGGMSPGTVSLVAAGSPFSFDGSTEGWVFNVGGGTGLAGATSSASDSPNDPSSIVGAITANRFGKSLATGTPYWEWSGTWEDLGVPAGYTVTAVDLDYDWRCSAYVTGASSTVGPAELRNSAGTLRNTFSASPAAFVATTAYATVNGANQTGLSDPSNTSIKLRIGVKPNTGSSNSASVTIDLDYVVLAITYVAAAVPADETVIDDFNRADGNVAVGGPWVNSDPTFAGATDLRVISNRLGTISGAQSAYTTTAVEGDDCDILVDVPVLAASGSFGWYLLVTNPGLSWAGYVWSISPSGAGSSILLRSTGGSTGAPLASLNITVPAGGTLWFSKRGSALKLYTKPSGGSYTLVSSVTDAGYNPVSAVIGLQVNDTTTRFDNLRGGPQIVAAPTTRPAKPRVMRQAVNRAAVI